jgi:hypothetical protein
MSQLPRGDANEISESPPPKDAQTSSGLGSIPASRSRIAKIKTVEVSEEELIRMESGDAESTPKSFALMLLPLTVGTATALFTATFASSAVQRGFEVTTYGGLVLSAYFCFEWWRKGKSKKSLLVALRDRMNDPDNHMR